MNNGQQPVTSQANPSLINRGKAFHEELAQAGIRHIFIIEDGSELRVGGHGKPKWIGKALIDAAYRIDAIVVAEALEKYV